MARRSGTAGERKIKYVGDADVRVLKAGDDFGGRLGDPLESDLVWNWENNHLLTTDAISEAALEILIDTGDFVDATDLETIPVAKVAARRRAAGAHEESARPIDFNNASQGALNRGGTAATPGSLSTGDTSGDAGQGETTSSTT